MEMEYDAFTHKMELMENEIDSSSGLIYEKIEKRNYHTALTEGIVHRTLKNLTYALGLLTLGNIERADRIINCVLDQQDTDPSHDTFGVWPYLFEEPLDKMLNPDWNWAVFMGRLLLIIRFDYSGKLPASTEIRIDRAISNAAECTILRNISPDYTNICIMSAFVTLGAGKLLRSETFTSFGREKLRRLDILIQKNGSITEYNSPDYGLVDLEEIGHILRYIDDSEITDIAERLNDHLWMLMATHFHPATGQLCPPHARCYDNIKGSRFLSFLQIGLGDFVDLMHGTPFSYDINWYYTRIRCPGKYHSYFIPANKSTFFMQDVYKGIDTIKDDEIRVHIEKGQGSITATSYLTPDYCIGSFNSHDLWNQRRPLMAYFENNGVTVMRIRCLNGDMDFSSAMITTLQEKSSLISAVNFVTDHGDYHFILDPLKDGKLICDQLSLQLELEGATDNVSIRKESNEQFFITIGNHQISFRFLFSEFGTTQFSPEVFEENGLKGIRLILHKEKNGIIDFSNLENALVVFSIQIDDFANNNCMIPKDGNTIQLRLGNQTSEGISSKPGIYLKSSQKQQKKFLKGGFLYQ
jgi:hypothetical protein